jgi:hypothetical protein
MQYDGNSATNMDAFPTPGLPPDLQLAQSASSMPGVQKLVIDVRSKVPWQGPFLQSIWSKDHEF